MKKNKLLSPCSRTSLTLKPKVNQQNHLSKKLKLHYDSLIQKQKPSLSNNCSRQYILSPRNYQKFQSKSNKIQKVQIRSQLLEIYCSSQTILQKFSILGIQNNKDVMFLNNQRLNSPIQNQSNQQKLIIVSTLQGFTQTYVNLVKAYDLNHLKQDQLKIQFYWYVLSSAINSTQIQQNFNKHYKPINFHFLDDILPLINYINIFNITKSKTELLAKSTIKHSELQKTLNTKQSYQNQIQNKKNKGFNQIYQILFKKDTNNFSQTYLDNTPVIKVIKFDKNTVNNFVDKLIQNCNNLALIQQNQFHKLLEQKTILNKLQSHNKLIYLKISLNKKHFLQILQQDNVNYIQSLLNKNKFNFIGLFNNKNAKKSSNFDQIMKLSKIEQKQAQLKKQLSMNLLKKVYNTKQIKKIILFMQKHKRHEQFIYLIINNNLQNRLIYRKSFHEQNKFVYLFMEQQQNTDLLGQILNQKQISYFIINQKDQVLYDYNKINFLGFQNQYHLYSQLFRKLNFKKLFSSQNCQQLSKFISFYVISSSQTVQKFTFIQQLVYFFKSQIKIIKSNQFVSQGIYDKMTQTKNKINILFGQIEDQQQKQMIFKNLLVIYLPKMNKISGQKLLNVINKAYNKFFSFISRPIANQSINQNKIHVYVFNFQQFSKKIQLEKNENLFNFELNQFQNCLKSITSLNAQRKQHSSYIFVFNMQEFTQDNQKSIENVRIKTQNLIEIYLKYGSQYIFRTQNGNYKFIKSLQLKNRIIGLIGNKISNNQTLQIKNAPYLVPKYENDLFQMNMLLNGQSQNKQDLIRHQNIPKIVKKPPIMVPTPILKIVPNLLKTLHIFVPKTIPLRCLQNRNQKQYSLLTYSSSKDPLLLLPYLDENDFVIILTKYINKEKLVKSNSLQAITLLNSTNLVKQKKYRIQQLKNMDQKQLIQTIDDLIVQFKLRSSQNLNKTYNHSQIPFIVFQNKSYDYFYKPKSSNSIKLNSSRSSKVFSQRQSTYSQSYDINHSNTNAENIFLKIINQHKNILKYFFHLSQQKFKQLIKEQKQTNLTNLLVENKIKLYYLGSKPSFDIFCSSFNNKAKLQHLNSIKELCLIIFNPMLKRLNNLSYKNNFKLNIQKEWLFQKLLNDKIEKRKLPQKLWKLSNKSQKNLSTSLIKIFCSLSLQSNNKSIFNFLSNKVEYFQTIQRLPTILWQLGSHKQFGIVLLHQQQYQHLTIHYFDAKTNHQVNNVIFINIYQLKNAQTQLIDKPHQKNPSILSRSHKQIQPTVNYIINEIDQLTKQTIQQKLSYGEQQIINYQQKYQRIFEQKYQIICYIQDYQYLVAIFDKMRQKYPFIPFHLHPILNFQSALNLHFKLFCAHLIVLPSEWSFLKIQNALMIDYKQSSFCRKLKIYFKSFTKTQFQI